jgi:hypothetical protein
MDLESPPVLEVLFLESPWAVMVACGVLALILLSSGLRRRIVGLKIAGGVAAATVIGIFTLAGAVTTDREQLLDDTRALVAATDPADWPALQRLIDPDAVLTGPDGAVWLRPGQVMPRLRRALGRININSQDVRTLQAMAHDGGRGESAVTVRTDVAGSGTGPINTGWRMTWQWDDAGGGWRVVDIRWMRFNGLPTPRGVMP